MKIKNYKLKKLIKESIEINLKEYLDFGDYIPGEDDESIADVRQPVIDKISKKISDFVLGVPVEEIFKDWKDSNKKGLLKKILEDGECYLKFDGKNLYWKGGGGGNYFNLPAGSGIEMLTGNIFNPVTDCFREKMHTPNKGPAPEGEYQVLKPQSKTGKLRDSSSILGACGFWIGGALKMLGVGKSVTLDWRNVNWSPMVNASWGNYRCATKMINVENPSKRYGIYVHGGYDQSSAGCIDLASKGAKGIDGMGTRMASPY